MLKKEKGKKRGSVFCGGLVDKVEGRRISLGVNVHDFIRMSYGLCDSFMSKEREGKGREGKERMDGWWENTLIIALCSIASITVP
jgi:hypothetical protein